MKYDRTGANDTPLGALVRARMKTLKLDRHALAKKLGGVEDNWVSQLFQYPHRLRLGTVEKLAKALGVSELKVDDASRKSAFVARRKK